MSARRSDASEDRLPESLVDAFAAMSHPICMELIGALGISQKDVTTLADALELDISAASHHLRKLRKHGILKMRKEGARHFYWVNEALRPETCNGTMRFTVRTADGDETAVTTVPRKAASGHRDKS